MWVLWMGIGVIVGSIVTSIIYSIRTTDGVLKIDRKDPEKDRCLLDIHDLTILEKKKRLIVRIDNDADLSQD